MYRFSDDKLLIKRLDSEGKSIHGCRYVVDSILIENCLTELEKDCIQLQFKHSIPTVDDKKFLVAKVGDSSPPLVNTVCLIGTYLARNNKYDIPVVNLINLLKGNDVEFKKTIDFFNSNFPDTDRATKKIHHRNKGDLAYRYFRLGLSFIADSIKAIHELEQENSILLKSDFEAVLSKLGVTQLNAYRIFQSKLHPSHARIMKDIHEHDKKVNFFHYNSNWYISLTTNSKFSATPSAIQQIKTQRAMTEHKPHVFIMPADDYTPVMSAETTESTHGLVNHNEFVRNSVDNSIVMDDVLPTTNPVLNQTPITSKPTQPIVQNDKQSHNEVVSQPIHKPDDTNIATQIKKAPTVDNGNIKTKADIQLNETPKPFNIFTQNKPVISTEQRVSNDTVTKSSVFDNNDDDDDFPIDIGNI